MPRTLRPSGALSPRDAGSYVQGSSTTSPLASVALDVDDTREGHLEPELERPQHGHAPFAALVEVFALHVLEQLRSTMPSRLLAPTRSQNATMRSGPGPEAPLPQIILDDLVDEVGRALALASLLLGALPPAAP